jgi:hypothetical protein
MGHDKTAGRYCYENGLHRVDVPTETGYRTEYIGNGAIFRISMVDEDAARLAAKLIHRTHHQPIGVWELKEHVRQLQAPAERGSVIDQEPEEMQEWDGGEPDYRKATVDALRSSPC